jgi:hypothetical protein
VTRGRLFRILLLIAILLALPALRERLRGPGVTITRRVYADSVRVDSTEGVVARGGGLPDSATAAARADSMRTILGASGTDTWIAEVIAEGDSVLRRWPVAPLRVVRLWLQDGRAVPNWGAGFVQAVQQGFDGWSHPDVPVRFLFVADSAAADVPVTWAAQLGGNRLGVTRADAWNDTIVRGAITIATTGTDGRPLTDAEIRRTALHEAGHLMGLPHASDTTSIMLPLAHVDAPSARDIATLVLLYRMPFGSIRDGGRRPVDERPAAPTPATSSASAPPASSSAPR